MVARSSLFCSIRSANFIMSIPRSVAGKRFHDGSLRALWAARTARSTSSAEAECTEVISFSVLENHYLATLDDSTASTYAGSMVESRSPF
jgi:hypothetical protein